MVAAFAPQDTAVFVKMRKERVAPHLDCHGQWFTNNCPARRLLLRDLTVYLQDKLDGFTEVLPRFLKRAALRVGARQFFDPCGPPVTYLLVDCGVRLRCHIPSLSQADWRSPLQASSNFIIASRSTSTGPALLLGRTGQCLWYSTGQMGPQEMMTMTALTSTEAAVVRTERGLTIAGTRITLYNIMDYVTVG